MCGKRIFGRCKKRILNHLSGDSLSRTVGRVSIHRAGFTLIELLVVIAIITLLLAILLPVTRQIRNQGRAVVCQSNLRQWGTIFHMYTQENQDYFFPSLVETAIWFIRGSYVRNNDPNIPPVLNDTNTQKYACCPMAQKVGSGHWGMIFNGIRIEGKMGSTFEAWDLSGPEPLFRCSYGFNDALFSPLFYGFPPKRISASIRYGVNISNVKGRDNIPIFFDSALPIDGFHLWEHRPPLNHEMGVFINRHNGCINVLFMDWSVRKIGLKGLYTLKWNMEFNTAGPWTKAGGIQPEDWPEWMQGFKDY
jgi:prepilin-type N-terminal cleavage/methylation domain-containing protein